MSRCQKNDRRGDSAEIVQKAERTAAPLGPATFNGRSNLRAPANPVNRATQGKSGLAMQATRLPN